MENILYLNEVVGKRFAFSSSDVFSGLTKRHDADQSSLKRNHSAAHKLEFDLRRVVELVLSPERDRVVSEVLNSSFGRHH